MSISYMEENEAGDCGRVLVKVKIRVTALINKMNMSEHMRVYSFY